MLGGGSSINGQLANRGAPDRLRRVGSARRRAAGTGTTCCPISRRSSATWISTGRCTARRAAFRSAASSPTLWTGHAKAAAKAFEEAGLRLSARPERRVRPDGYFPITISNLYDRRVSAAIGYLDTGTRAAPEPDDLGRDAGDASCCSRARTASASRRWSRAASTEFRAEGGHPLAPARSTRRRICCAPASARSAHLRDLGIEVRANLPGVGQRLMDHPSISVSSFIKPRGAPQRADAPAHPRWRCAIRRGSTARRRATCSSPASANRPGTRSASRSPRCWSRSTRPIPRPARSGSPPRDWRAEPIVEFNLLSDRRDLERLMDGFRRLGAMQMSAALQGGDQRSVPGQLQRPGAPDRRRQRQEPAHHRVRRQAARRPGLRCARWIIDRYHRRGLPLRPGDDRRRRAGGLHPQGRDRRVARLLHLPHGRRRRPDGGHRQSRAGCAASRGCAWSTPRSSRRCPAPTPISRP